MQFELRALGASGLLVTPIALGCWPIAGITSIDVTESASLATIANALDSGLNFFDTAYCYGYQGESEKMVGQVLRPVRDQVVIASKGGICWNSDFKQIRMGRPSDILRQCEESLSRLGIDTIDLYYLHAPDPTVPVSESAGAFRELMNQGKIRAAGLSNATTSQLAEFHRECPLAAYQPHFNMLQREIEDDQLPWCQQHGVAVVVYWPLMKGLLAGKLSRNHQFDPKDGRRKYPMFHGEEWERNQDFLDELRTIAHGRNVTVAQLVLNWTIQRAGITVSICGAKRPDQIADNAATLHWKLTVAEIETINNAIVRRGPIVSRSAV